MSFLSALLGLDSSHNAGVAQKQANQYQTQAAGGFQNLSNIAQGVQTPQDSNILNLLSQFGATANINTGLPTAGQGGYGIAPAGGNQVTVGGVPQGQQAGQPQGYGAQQQAYKQQQSAQQQQLQNGPYALNQAQSQNLNQQIDRINVQKKADLAAVTEQLNKQGLGQSPAQVAAITQMVNEHYDAYTAQTTTDFYDKIAKEKEAALSQLVSTLTGLQEQGSAGLASLGGAQQNTALAQQQQSQEQFGGLLSLGSLLAGGFSGGGGGIAPIAASSPAVGFGGGGTGFGATSGALAGLGDF